jgi:hypothetical protein
MYGWLLEYVKDEDRRVLLGKWSMCLAAPHVAGSFRDFCKDTGRIRRTSERYLQNEFQRISSELIKFFIERRRSLRGTRRKSRAR